MNLRNEKRSSRESKLLFKNIFVLIVLTFFISCSMRVDTRRLDQESKNFCPENMMYINMDTFVMGRDSESDESPAHNVSNEPFCIDKYEYPNIRGSRPEIGLSFLEAQELCTKQGKRLCTEAEWEGACKGPKNNLYPWGNNQDNTLCYIGRINQYKTGTKDFCYSDLGVFDMSGGVWEWTSDWYQSYPGKVNPFSEIGNKRVLRGGYWLSSFEMVTCSSRFPLTPETNDIPTIGTRCCKSPDKSTSIQTHNEP
ncbi:formylglycine-generating enzyme family protein [bacterium]|nr:formylglycine-generating enzyme family protein [bacterium]